MRREDRFDFSWTASSTLSPLLFLLSLPLLSNLNLSLSLRLLSITGGRPRDEESKGKRKEGRVGKGGVLGSAHLSHEMSLQDLSTFVLQILSCDVQGRLPILRIKWEERRATMGLTLSLSEASAPLSRRRETVAVWP
jgi:hypothetical protein